MGHLGEGMNACVGSARSLKFESVEPERFAKGPLKFSLDGSSVLLGLPSAITGSLVFYR
jgi:hypothetical protein